MSFLVKKLGVKVRAPPPHPLENLDSEKTLSHFDSWIKPIRQKHMANFILSFVCNVKFFYYYVFEKYQKNGNVCFPCSFFSSPTQMWHEYNSGTRCELDSANYLLNRKSVKVKMSSFF